MSSNSVISSSCEEETDETDEKSISGEESEPWYRGKTSHVLVVSYWNEQNIVCAVELSYIGQDCHEIPPILGKIYGHQTRRLDVSFNAIRIFDGLEMFPILEELILDNNDLSDLVHFIALPNLHTLSLNKNHFVDLDALMKQLVKCYPNLTYLSLLGNPACPDQLSNLEKDEDDYKRYRYYILHKIPGLKFLDSTPVRQFERIESQRVGSFMNVVKPSIEVGVEVKSDSDEEVDPNPYTPLPPVTKREGTHRGSFGKLRQRYTGAQSEGNRFIRDHEL